MEDIVVGEETVLKHPAKLKVDKSPGLDKLHPRLLKKPLSILINQSINRKSLHNDWKKAQISAIVIKGTNYKEKTTGLSILHQLFVKH